MLLRKPRWCNAFLVNGKAYDTATGFVELSLANGDTLAIDIRSQVQPVKVAEGYIVVKEPLVYTLKITPD